MPVIREAFLRKSLTPETINIITASLSNNTLKQYNTAYRKWWQFCQTHKVDCYTASIQTVLHFLSREFETGASYTTLNTYRSALGLIIGRQLSTNDIVSRFMKGVFKLKPVFPRYQSTWDTNVVLDFLFNYFPNENLCINKLTKKLVTLLALSTLSCIRVSNINICDSNIIITIDDLLKTSAPGRQTHRLIIPFFPNKIEICPGRTLCSYINVTDTFRTEPNTDRLLLTTKRPVHNASSSTISRWIKQTLADSGIDTTIFTSHSTRHAATSAASRRGISIDLIKKTAGWSGNSLVFGKFYNRPLLAEETNDFARAVYENNV